MAKGMQTGWEDQVDQKLYHHGLIKILVKKELEAKGMTWVALLEKLHKKTPAGKKTKDPASPSTSTGLVKNNVGGSSRTGTKRKRPIETTEEEAPS